MPTGPYRDLLALLSGKQEKIDAFRKEAERDFKELLTLTEVARLRRVTRAHSRLRNPILVDLLIEESRRMVTAAPKAALTLAECASVIALRVEHKILGPAWAATTIARASAYRGNASRATGNLRDAERLLRFADQLFEANGNGDPLVIAEFASLKASLRFDQRRFEAAEKLLDESFNTYEALGQQTDAARVLINQGRLFAELQEPERAIQMTRAAAQRIDVENHARLYLSTQFNLAVYLEEFGQHEQALSLLEEQRPLFERFQDPWTMVRYRWYLGVVMRGMGRLEEAEVALSGARGEFLAAGHNYDASLVGLDLALGLTALQQLAEELLPALLQENLEREVIGALLLFRRAVEEETTTPSMVTQIIRTMRTAKRWVVEAPS